MGTPTRKPRTSSNQAIVVGAGPVGVVTAIMLAHVGWSVQVLHLRSVLRKALHEVQRFRAALCGQCFVLILSGFRYWKSLVRPMQWLPSLNSVPTTSV